MEIILISISAFLFTLIVLLPIKQILPTKKLRKLVNELNKEVFLDKAENQSIKERFFWIAESVHRKLNFRIEQAKLLKYNDLIVKAGLKEKVSIECFLGMKIIAPTVVFLLYFLLYLINGFSGNLLLLTITMPLVGYYVPDNVLNGKVKKRQWTLQVELPYVLNTLAIITDAGLSLNEAIQKVCEIREGALVQELKKVIDEINIGILQRDALLRMSERCGVSEISSFIFTLIQNLEKGSSGVPIILKEQSKEIWEKRKNKARELGEKASMKLFLPMMLLTFPCLLIFLLGPALISLFQMFNS